MTNEQKEDLIILLGEERIRKAVAILGTEKVSFPFLLLSLRRRCIIKALQTEHSIARIAKQFAVSRMTVYRIYRGQKKSQKTKYPGHNKKC